MKEQFLTRHDVIKITSEKGSWQIIEYKPVLHIVLVQFPEQLIWRYMYVSIYLDNWLNVKTKYKG
jgi:hypothetical protein